MDQYLEATYAVSRLVTEQYSTSFSMASRRFSKDVRVHIYAIYGLTRLADEIVDTYHGKYASKLLDELERETYEAIQISYSTNPITHAFANTANTFGIDKVLIAPFFNSMRTDLKQKTFNDEQYRTYIHGSAEVVGLMCLRVFCNGENRSYNKLKVGAAQLGAAYQKVNFLRDIAADHQELGRYYFPIGSFKKFDEATKQYILDDIRADFKNALPAAQHLPDNAIRAVLTSYRYYTALYRKLRRTPAETLKVKRIRINNLHKLILLFLPLNKGVK